MSTKWTRIAWTFVPAIALVLGAAADEPDKKPVSKPPPARDAKNLVANGDFEDGDITPKGWQTVDNLTSFWVKDDDPAHGKCLKFDTDVLQMQAYDWWVKMLKDGAPIKDAPKKISSQDPNKYDTLAAFDGAFMWSDPFPVKKGQAYWLTLDVKGPAGMILWLVGYKDKPDTAFGADMAAFQEYLKEKVTGKPKPNQRNFTPFIHNYQWKGQLVVGGSDQWKTYSRREKPFRPTNQTPEVRWMRVFLLPYWPPGTYYVDNVRVTEYQEKD
jgi:hypothetical protein